MEISEKQEYAGRLHKKGYKTYSPRLYQSNKESSITGIQKNGSKKEKGGNPFLLINIVSTSVGFIELLTSNLSVVSITANF